MRVYIRTSRWAVWSRRLSGFALPLVLIPIFMHRAGALASDTFLLIEAVAICLAVAGLVAGIAGFVSLWHSGDRGWPLALSGFVLAVLCLLPATLVGLDFMRYPLVGEFSTDTANPPELISDSTPAKIPPDVAARLTLAFPTAHSRNYPVATAQVFTIADKLVRDRGWQVQVIRAPKPGFEDGQINAIAMTFFGWRDEVSIRVTGTPASTEVAMRSASLSAIHGPGANGKRVENFLKALDAKLALLMHDEPAGAAGGDSDVEAGPPAPPASGDGEIN